MLLLFAVASRNSHICVFEFGGYLIYYKYESAKLTTMTDGKHEQNSRVVVSKLIAIADNAA